MWPWELLITCTQGQGPENEAGSAHQHVLGCHLRTCCFPFKVTLEKKLPFQLCPKQEQQNKALLFGNEPSSKSSCPQIKTGMENYTLAQSPAIPPCSCNHKDFWLLPNMAQCSCMSFMLPSWGWRAWWLPFRHDREEPLKRSISISLQGPELNQAQRAGACSEAEHSSAQGHAACLWLCCSPPAWPGVVLFTSVCLSCRLLQALSTVRNSYMYKLSPTIC